MELNATRNLTAGAKTLLVMLFAVMAPAHSGTMFFEEKIFYCFIAAE